MSHHDLLVDSITYEETCPKCGQKFLCTYEEQIPGFRMSDDKICPHCGAVLRTSLEYEFTTRKI